MAKNRAIHEINVKSLNVYRFMLLVGEFERKSKHFYFEMGNVINLNTK